MPEIDKQLLEDDSSTALGLSHKASHEATATEEAMRREEVSRLRKLGITDVVQVVPANVGAYDALIKRQKELNKLGMNLADAWRQALRESPSDAAQVQEPPEKKTDYMGAPTAILMDTNKKTSGGHSKKGRTRKPAKKKALRTGPMWIEEVEPRSNKTTVYMSDSTLNTLEKQPFNTNTLLQALALELENRALEDILSEDTIDLLTKGVARTKDGGNVKGNRNAAAPNNAVELDA